MHAQTLIVSLLASVVVATPLVERAYVTEYNVVTNVVTVTAGSGATPTRYPHGRKHRGHKHRPAKQPVDTPSVYQPPNYPRPSPTKSTPKAKPTTYNPPSSGQPSGSYADKVIKHHNAHRANHSADALQWSDALASTAQKIAEGCVFAHNTDMDNGGYGQNIAAGVAAENISAVITDAFYNGEISLYDGYYGGEPNTANFHAWGHFSQIVWAETTEVGCATYHCPGGLSGVSGNTPPDFTVCNYKGPGNFADKYAENVLQPRGDATIHWNSL